MKNISDVLPETGEYTETNDIGECFNCEMTKELSTCKQCNIGICNDCRIKHRDRYITELRNT